MTNWYYFTNSICLRLHSIQCKWLSINKHINLSIATFNAIVVKIVRNYQSSTKVFSLKKTCSSLISASRLCKCWIGTTVLCQKDRRQFSASFTLLRTFYSILMKSLFVITNWFHIVQHFALTRLFIPLFKHADINMNN